MRSESMDYNSLSDEELKAQFPGLYQQMSDMIAQMIEGKSPDELQKAMELMMNSSNNGGDIYGSDGSKLGNIFLQHENQNDNSVDDELMKELFSGYGVDESGEIRRNEGAKNQLKGIVDNIFD